MNSLSSNKYSDDIGLLGGIPETIKIQHAVQHVFTLKFSDKLERPVRKLLDISKHYADSFQLIAAGIGSYFFFSGVAKLVLAYNTSTANDDGKKNKTKNRNPRSKESGNASLQPPSSTTSKPANAKESTPNSGT